MKIAQLLANKNPFVATIKPSANVAHLIDELKQHNIGAVVVTEDGRSIDGIVSERDVVRTMPSHLSDVATLKVSDIMTTEVFTCTPDDSIESIMESMTDRRFRHVPVVDGDGALVGVISIGDLVKQRLADLHHERDALINYITG